MPSRIRAVVIALAAAVIAGCGDPAVEVPAGRAPRADSSATSSTTGHWRFVSLEVDGEALVVDEPLFLDITDRGFSASTTCNAIGGRFAGELTSTLMGCEGDDARGERLMADAFGTEPTAEGDRLVFESGDVRLVDEAFTDPTPTELFAVLADPNAAADESALPSEEATGSVPPRYDQLARVPSPSDAVDLFVGVLHGDVCLVHGTATAIGATCSPPRMAAATSYAFDVPRYEPPIVRVALIPDRFGPAVAGRPDLGTYDTNILTVGPDAPEGDHILTDDDGERFLLRIPPPWFDPMAASRTTPDER